MKLITDEFYFYDYYWILSVTLSMVYCAYKHITWNMNNYRYIYKHGVINEIGNVCGSLNGFDLYLGN